MEAPYPSDTRARGWRFELDMEKVKASDTWLRARRGEVKGALLLLWSEAWQQTPCGSLPNDDELVALLIDMPAPTFVKHRAVLMRGWTLADDGRLYHDTITQRVRDMLAKRAKDAKRAAENRARRTGAAPTPPEITGASHVTPPGPAPEFDTKHQAPGSSVPNGTDGAGAPAEQKPEKTVDELARTELWRAAVSVLEQGGCPKAQCRTFMGKLVGDYTFETVQKAVAQAVTAQPADAREYLKATCQRLKGERKDPLTVPSNAAAETSEYLAKQGAQVPLTKEQRAAVAERLKQAREVATSAALKPRQKAEVAA